jgi:uncharacterized membrane protein YozB (DUF420 family)
VVDSVTPAYDSGLGVMAIWRRWTNLSRTCIAASTNLFCVFGNWYLAQQHPTNQTEMRFNSERPQAYVQLDFFFLGVRDVFAGIDLDLDAQVEFRAFQKLGNPTTKRRAV